MIPYENFLKDKTPKPNQCGKVIKGDNLHSILFPFQRDLTVWCIRKGRASLFADTGLGKTFMQLEWARNIGTNALIVAPLSVSRQTQREAKKLDIDLPYIRKNEEITTGLQITNYEMVTKINTDRFDAVVLDESSILKALDGKTRKRLTDQFSDTPYRLCCTATPAPNDITEMANHAEFLGVDTRANMLATYFVHDDIGWRLKGHAHEAFFRWLASWGMFINFPSDLGYEDDGYILPKLDIEVEFVKVDYRPDDALFFTGMKGIQDRSRIRKVTMDQRIDSTINLINGSTEQWIIWCGLNDESAKIAKLLPDAREVKGSDKTDYKTRTFEDFQDGKFRILVTKPKIGGFGMNFQNAHKMAFLGLSDSWESYYQCIRRSYRFGQSEPVTAVIVLSNIEDAIYQNIKRKEVQANFLKTKLIENIKEFEKEELNDMEQEEVYQEETVEGEGFKLMLGDSCKRLEEIESDSVGLSVFSPPFLSLYTYSPSARDIGNSQSTDVFSDHFGFLVDHLLRITMPGRNCAVHVAQVPAMLARDGYIGMKDFRGLTIRLFENRDFIYHGEVCIDKDPQAQAIRTKSKSLLFTQLKKDSSWLRPALADYILVFRKPGENSEPIKPNITNNQWIEWARPIWYGIRESNTLNVAEGRDNKDERHICPLQLETIERVIKLWSNKGDLVCSPFMGIGSEGFQAIEMNRRFVGCELKESYFKVAIGNIQRAGRGSGSQITLWED